MRSSLTCYSAKAVKSYSVTELSQMDKMILAFIINR